MEKLPKLPEFLYGHIEVFSGILPEESPKIKVRMPPELINRVNEIIDLLNELSKSKIIRSAIALEKENKEKENNG